MKTIQVRVINFPISKRYCHVGYEATLDVLNSKIRCQGAWFDFDDRWKVEEAK